MSERDLVDTQRQITAGVDAVANGLRCLGPVLGDVVITLARLEDKVDRLLAQRPA